jgi:hypothetical protein
MIPKAEYQRTAEKRGGAGTYRQVSPNPRTTHSPKPKIQGACL